MVESSTKAKSAVTPGFAGRGRVGDFPGGVSCPDPDQLAQSHLGRRGGPELILGKGAVLPLRRFTGDFPGHRVRWMIGRRLQTFAR